MVGRVTKDQWYVSFLLYDIFTIYDEDTQRSRITWLTLHRVTLVLKVKAAMLDPMAHQDLREALVSLVSKDSWYSDFIISLKILYFIARLETHNVGLLCFRATSESEGLKESLDPKENL